jgi:hypothetical protein
MIMGYVRLTALLDAVHDEGLKNLLMAWYYAGDSQLFFQLHGTGLTLFRILHGISRRQTGSSWKGRAGEQAAMPSMRHEME